MMKRKINLGKMMRIEMVWIWGIFDYRIGAECKRSM